MSKQATLRNIGSFLMILLIHLIKNQVEQRLTNSWAASIANSIRGIKKLNLKDNKTSYYINDSEWESFLEDELEAAIREASREVLEGKLSRVQLNLRVDRDQIIAIATGLLLLTYNYSRKELEDAIDEHLGELPGGEDLRSFPVASE
jgi:TPP-dependent indolepyruvate ferredoxin oxidoreductase alpha subunit